MVDKWAGMSRRLVQKLRVLWVIRGWQRFFLSQIESRIRTSSHSLRLELSTHRYTVRLPARAFGHGIAKMLRLLLLLPTLT